jgi:hypothetical protein
VQGQSQGELQGEPGQQSGQPAALSFTVTFTGGTAGGSGIFYLYPDGQRFSGIWRASDGTFDAWSGSRAAPPIAASEAPGGPGSEGGPGAKASGGPGSEAPPGIGPGGGTGDQVPSAGAGAGQVSQMQAQLQPLPPPPVTAPPSIQFPRLPALPVPGLPLPQVPAAPPRPTPIQLPKLPATPQTPVPPPVQLPRGACPGPEAVVTQQLSVRDGEAGQVLPPALASGTLVECVACDQNWCLIADSNPHATVPRPSLDFSFATPKPPAAPPQATPPASPRPMPSPQVPAKVAGANFAGDWSLRSDRDWKDELILTQAGAAVTGSFVDQSGLTGRVRGQVTGNMLRFSWTEDGGHVGTGSFTMGADQASISGSFGPDPYSVDPSSQQGKWQGPRRDATADFSGGWIVVSNKNWTYFLTVKQSGNTATATFTDQSGVKGRLTGVVADDTWYYSWSEDGGYTGGGTFTMAIDDNGFGGVYHANANGATPESSGSWSGKHGGGGTVLPGPAKPAAPAVPNPPDFGGCPGCGGGNGGLMVK